jgi:hypothetical protein
MTRRTKLIGIVAGTVAIVAAGAGIAVGAGGDDDEPAITGQDLERATKAALDHTGGGRVTETEVGDEESYYEVEVTLADGGQIDVQLDENFNVVSTSGNDETDDNDD